MTDRKCENCVFFDRLNDYHGRCRVSGPCNSDYAMKRWPKVAHKDWCGRFRERKSESETNPAVVVTIPANELRLCRGIGAATMFNLRPFLLQYGVEVTD